MAPDCGVLSSPIIYGYFWGEEVNALLPLPSLLLLLLITSLNLSQDEVNVDLCPILGTYRGTLILQKSSQSTFHMSLRCVLGGGGSTSASHPLLGPTPPSRLCCNPSMSIDSFHPHTVRQARETMGTASGPVLRRGTQQAVGRVLFPSLSPYQLLFVWLFFFFFAI